MREIEVKILEIDSQKVQQQLAALGAIQTFSGEMQALFFDDKQRSITHRGDVLRIRREGEAIRMTYKTHVEKEAAKVMDEYEVELTDVDMMTHILEKLGLEQIKETRKIRIEYTFEEIKIVIDRYLGEMSFIPVFMEIEAPTLKDIYTMIEKLSLDKQKIRNWNTYDLIQHYGH